MTKTEQIIAQVKAGTHRITAYGVRNGRTMWILSRWDEKRGIWLNVSGNTRCIAAASKAFNGVWMNNIQGRLFKAESTTVTN